MNLLIFGIALFAAVHLVSAVVPSAVASLKSAVGANGYRAVHAVLSLAGVAMIVIGWRSSVPVVVYAPPPWGMSVAFVLMFAAIYLIGASHGRLRIRRVVRNPQLTAVVLWAIAHLLANGDIRSIVLFTSLGAWALVEIALLNRRDGEWHKPPAPSMKTELIGAAIGIVVFLVLLALHPYFAGVSPLPA
ncbi:MAG: NnrU family protein [Woeseiaceae bacterium]|nr:NnrU family protein [Woeseiaceae bacterium]